MDYLKKIFDWLGNWWDSITGWFQDMFYWVVNTAIAIVGQGIEWAAGIFPSYTVPVPTFADNGFLNVLSWVFPVREAIALMGVLAAAIVGYLTVGTALRWLRVIR